MIAFRRACSGVVAAVKEQEEGVVAGEEAACQRPSTGKGYPKECSEGVRWW